MMMYDLSIVLRGRFVNNLRTINMVVLFLFMKLV